MKSVIVIAEGSTELGLGHVSRCLSLARLLRPRATVRFLTTSERAVRDRIEAAGFDAVPAGAGYEDSLDVLPHPDTVVIDKLELEEPPAAWIHEQLRSRLVILGNSSAANRHADVVVNAIVGTRFQNRRRRDETSGALYLEGPRFVVLRDEFYELSNAYAHRGSLQRVLLLFGGSDPANLTCRALRALLADPRPVEIVACAGALFGHLNELDELAVVAASRGRQLEIVRDSSEVSGLMLASDFLLTSPGNTLFEAFALGVPCLAFNQNASQEEMFAGFPMTRAQAEIDRAPELMLAAYRDYAGYRAAAAALEVGMGRDEIADAVVAPVSGAAELEHAA